MIPAIPPKLTDVNKNYMVHIWGNDESGTPIYGSTGIWASLPEEFSIETTAEWTPILAGLAQKIQSGVLGNLSEATETAIKAAGYSTMTKYTSHLVWSSTSPIVMRIPIKLDAVYDAKQDVSSIVLRLLSLTLPSEIMTPGNDIVNQTLYNTLDPITPLSAPGPTMALNSKYKVHMSLGRLLFFPNIIITGVSAMFNTRPTTDGDFISADVDVTISTPTIYTKRDLYTTFRTINNTIVPN
jgi:hypothetical protein